MAVVQGSNPGLLRHVATGLRATATVLAGVSTTYLTLASIEAMKLKKGIGLLDAAENATRQTRIEDFQRKAKDYAESSNSMFAAANAADTKAVTQETVSDASGFVPPMDFPDLPDFRPPPFDDELPDNPDPIDDLPDGGGSGGGSPGRGGPISGGAGPGLSGLGVDSGAGPYLAGAGGDGDGDLGTAGYPGEVADAPGSSDNAAAGQRPDQGVLGLVPGGPIGVGAAALAAGGIAASVIWANRRDRQRHEDEGEERDRDGDKVEAVYQTGPPERPAAG